MKRHFYLIANEAMVKGNWRDMNDDARVSVIKQYKDVNSIFSFIRRIHFSPKINRIISLPWKELWCDSVRKIKWGGVKTLNII